MKEALANPTAIRKAAEPIKRREFLGMMTKAGSLLAAEGILTVAASLLAMAQKPKKEILLECRMFSSGDPLIEHVKPDSYVKIESAGMWPISYANWVEIWVDGRKVADLHQGQDELVTVGAITYKVKCIELKELSSKTLLQISIP